MAKDFKEKYEKVCGIKDKALCLVETQMNGDITSVDAEELGEVADIAKDMAELMMYCAQAEYYHEVVEAMHKGSDEENSYYLNKYNPEYDGKFYDPMRKVNYARQRDSRGRYMYDPMDEWDYEDDKYRTRMYYSSMNGGSSNNGGSMNYARDYREGRSPMVRRTYMEMKENGEDKTKTTKELEKYMSELGEDMTEMIQGMDANEKTMLKQKLATLASKIV